MALLVVERTWDDRPAGPEERALVRVVQHALGLHVVVDAPFHADPPPPAAPGPTWGLWEHEVVEVFVLGAGEAYTELELGPHGHHLLLRLAGRRSVVERELPLEAEWVPSRVGRWAARAELPSAVLPVGPWRFNAYAIHGCGANRRYLAWSPAGGEAPDFHALHSFRPLP